MARLCSGDSLPVSQFAPRQPLSNLYIRVCKECRNIGTYFLYSFSPPITLATLSLYAPYTGLKVNGCRQHQRVCPCIYHLFTMHLPDDRMGKRAKAPAVGHKFTLFEKGLGRRVVVAEGTGDEASRNVYKGIQLHAMLVLYTYFKLSHL